MPQTSRSWKSAVRLDWGCAETGPIAEGPRERNRLGSGPPYVVVGDGHCLMINVIDLLFRDGVLKLCDTQTFAMPTKSTFAK